MCYRVSGVSAHEVISLGQIGLQPFMNYPLARPGAGGPWPGEGPAHPDGECAHARHPAGDHVGRLVNERQPDETVQLISSEIDRRDLASPLKINILGMAFKGLPETSDLHGSMAIKVLDALKKAHPKAETGLYDPVTSPEVLASEFPDEKVFNRFGDAVSGASMVVIASNHASFGTISPRTISKFISPNGFVFDYWNHFSHLPVLRTAAIRTSLVGPRQRMGARRWISALSSPAVAGSSARTWSSASSPTVGTRRWSTPWCGVNASRFAEVADDVELFTCDVRDQEALQHAFSPEPRWWIRTSR